jgi:hypothetical protein
MSKNFTLCLNMIVKDESAIIVSTLTNICEKLSIDYWVICDTGSTDNTKELIKEFFKLKNIEGELYEDKWISFGDNRTLALNKAYNKTDYLLIFDADDKIVGDLIFPTNIFEYDSYMLSFGKHHTFKRKQLINNRKKWKYMGVIHEYLECLEKDVSYTINGNYYIIAGTTGFRNNDPDKYKKDAMIAEKAYYEALEKKDPMYGRYSFYCANGYKDAEDKENAIKWYKNTLKLDNWVQEKYMCCLNLHYLYDSLENIESAIFYAIKTYEYDNTRVEGIYNLIKYYCIHNQNEIAFSFYLLIQNYYENEYVNDTFNSKLFVSRDIYSFYLPYYMIIVCERLKKYDIGLKMIDIIFTQDEIVGGEWWIKNVIYNLQFFIDKNKDISFVHNFNSYIKKINDKKYDIDRNLINKYEIINISNFLQINPPNQEKIIYDDDSYVVLAILAKDKESTLDFYLDCIYKQTYDKKYIHLYIRTNDNNDDTQNILLNFSNTYGNEYASVYYDDTDITDELKKYSNHEWNVLRFHILGKIRQESIQHAMILNAHYFVVDCDNFIIPSTLENMMKNKNMGIVSPLLKIGYTDTIINEVYKNSYKENSVHYSNYHYNVDENGYYNSHPNYYSILNDNVKGLTKVCCVHCVYLIPNKYLSSVCYNDNSNRYEYVIFSHTMRRYSIPQYIDNTEKYGYLTFLEDKNLVEIEKNFWKSTFFD